MLLSARNDYASGRVRIEQRLVQISTCTLSNSEKLSILVTAIILQRIAWAILDRQMQFADLSEPSGRAR